MRESVASNPAQQPRAKEVDEGRGKPPAVVRQGGVEAQVHPEAERGAQSSAEEYGEPGVNSGHRERLVASA